MSIRMEVLSREKKSNSCLYFFVAWILAESLKIDCLLWLQNWSDWMVTAVVEGIVMNGVVPTNGRLWLSK